jgi:hypothetical protein
MTPAAFAPPLTVEMHELWREYSDPDIRRLLLEVVHLRGVLGEIENPARGH